MIEAIRTKKPYFFATISNAFEDETKCRHRILVNYRGFKAMEPTSADDILVVVNKLNINFELDTNLNISCRVGVKPNLFHRNKEALRKFFQENHYIPGVIVVSCITKKFFWISEVDWKLLEKKYLKM